MRGIYTATYLDALQKHCCAKRNLPAGLDVGKAFQLIVGTSTGAIIGCGLAKGVSPLDIAKLYEQHGSLIFPKKIPKKIDRDLIFQLWTRPAYLNQGNAALASALDGVFGKMTIGELWTERKIALSIPAVNMSNYRAWVFKTPHDPNSNHRDDKYTLADVCRASSAAPLFRSLAAIDDPNGNGYDVFADGGLWSNNPVIVALVEALRMTAKKEEEIEIFCLGSCGRPEGNLIDKNSLDRGIVEWKFGGEAATVSIASQEFAFDMIGKMLLPHLKKTVKIVRFPTDKIPASMLDFLDLDETSAIGFNALKQQARNDANTTNSLIGSHTPDGLAIEALFNDMPARVSSPKEE